MWRAIRPTWGPLQEVGLVRAEAPSEKLLPQAISNQIRLSSRHPSMTPFSLTYDHTEQAKKQASPNDLLYQASSSLAKPPTKLVTSRPGRRSVRTTPQPIEQNERAGHVHRTTTVGRPHSVQLQLAGTESN